MPLRKPSELKFRNDDFEKEILKKIIYEYVNELQKLYYEAEHKKGNFASGESIAYCFILHWLDDDIDTFELRNEFKDLEISVGIESSKNNHNQQNRE
ncbi:hypothetical protein [Endomicrobium proavitum]|uniref:Uncharacterized protein n=1 Tax=Endomicrobium proavitum TaxID=1408281 RepID=A0A0G3WGY8_9BACT|nr:hypothetical protein [Endomicrobium proavitum]AKL97936.1 hypothetical protein Epro_0557 [Endomicrobium proavitum]